MADLLTRDDVLSALRRLPAETVLPDRDPVTYGLVTDRMAAYALLLRELPAEPAPPAAKAEPAADASAQDPACPYPPVLTRWGLATWKVGDWRLFLSEGKAGDQIAIIDDGGAGVWGGLNGTGVYRSCAYVDGVDNLMSAILAALRELGSLPDEVSDAP